MSETVKCVELPSGGWWQIETRPRWKHVRESGNGTEWDGLEHYLATLTIAWGFAEGICSMSILERSEDDIAAVLEVLNHGLARFARDEGPRELAEKLFAAMVAGQIPREFDEVSVLAATGWSWQELQETPADVVRMMSTYLYVSQARKNGCSLEFNIEQGGQSCQATRD